MTRTRLTSISSSKPLTTNTHDTLALTHNHSTTPTAQALSKPWVIQVLFQPGRADFSIEEALTWKNRGAWNKSVGRGEGWCSCWDAVGRQNSGLERGASLSVGELQSLLLTVFKFFRGKRRSSGVWYGRKSSVSPITMPALHLFMKFDVGLR